MVGRHGLGVLGRDFRVSPARVIFACAVARGSPVTDGTVTTAVSWAWLSR